MPAKPISAFFILGIFIYADVLAQTNETSSVSPGEQYKNGYNFIISSLPDSFSFAGETVPLHDELIREQWERELLYNADFFGNIAYIIKLSGRHFSAIEAALREHGIPEDMSMYALQKVIFST